MRRQKTKQNTPQKKPKTTAYSHVTSLSRPRNQSNDLPDQKTLITLITIKSSDSLYIMKAGGIMFGIQEFSEITFVPSCT